MPVNIKDLDGGRGSLIEGYGVLTGDEYRSMIKKHLSQDPEKLKQYIYCLCDLNGVTQLAMNASDISYVAEVCKEAAAINRQAVVALVANKDHVFGMSRMWEMMFDGKTWEVMVLRDRGEAETWIRERVKEKTGLEEITIS